MTFSAATTPTPGVGVEYPVDPPRGRRIGIALSGGGIRSAAFNLGAIQALQEARVLGSSDYIAAVSGGNYIASALTVAHSQHDPSLANGMPYWSHGSPEERHLRRSTNYLAPGYIGRTWLAASVVFGFLVNYLPFLLVMFVAGRVLGWLVHAAGIALTDLLPSSLFRPDSRIAAGLVLAIGVLVATALLLVAFRRLHDGRQGGTGYGEGKAEPTVAVLVSLAAGTLLLLLLPVLAGAYAGSFRFLLVDVLRGSADDFDSLQGRLAVSTLWLLVMLGLAAVAIVLSGRTRARRTLLVLSAVAGAGLLLVPLISSLEYSVRHGFQGLPDLLTTGSSMAVVVLMAILVHNRRYSLHLFYRERLSSAFALERSYDAERKRVVARPIDYAKKLTFSEVGAPAADGHDEIPKLIVCCAVNITTADVPVGRFAESFTFEYDKSGGPRFDYHDTKRFETSRGLRGTELTLPSLMAVSGAALSPLMGRFTYPPLRFLMALTNVRLGVWIMNPQHPTWQRERPEPTTPLRKLIRAIQDGWHEPGALYVLREAIGGLNLDRRFIYLTDGGHWENLGLVELLRRQCTDVLCFDASASQIGAGQDLGRAIALARSELGVDIAVDPRSTVPDAEGVTRDTAVRGTITYRGGRTARLVYARAALTPEASWDLAAFKARDSRFPNHATTQQIFTDELFEAYRTLGHSAGRRAVDLLNIPPAQLRSFSGTIGSEGENGGRAARDGHVGLGRG